MRSRRIAFLVEGQRFETTEATIQQYPSLLSTMAEDTNNNEGAITIDGIGTDTFRLILNFLRDGPVALCHCDNPTVEELNRAAKLLHLSALHECIANAEWEAESCSRWTPQRGDKCHFRDTNLAEAMEAEEALRGEDPSEELCRQCGETLKGMKSLRSARRCEITDVATVRKVCGPSALCVNVTFGRFITVFHLPSKYLKLI